MKICGVIAEYNPFHNGHARHLAETLQILGSETAIICVMSGNYTQRGDFAVLEKYRRAEMAARCGADLVLELPLSSCLSSAEGFAFGGIALLHALGCVSYLSFGSECGEIQLIRQAAKLQKSQQAQAALRHALAKGLPYAAAMQHAVMGLDENCSLLFSQPNNTLGIAYCAALDTLHSTITPMTIRREGAAHDAKYAVDAVPSASLLRTLLTDGQSAACQPLMPPQSWAVLQDAMQQGAAPVLCDAVDTAIVSYLRRLSPTDFSRYCGGADGLEYRLYEIAQKYASFTEICAAAQTRRYPLARIRRVLFRAWLNLPANLPYMPSFVRVLALGKYGRDILRNMKRSCALPVIMKPSAAPKHYPSLASILEQDRLADDLYALAFPAPALRRGGESLRKTPYIYFSNKHNMQE